MLPTQMEAARADRTAFVCRRTRTVVTCLPRRATVRVWRLAIKVVR